MQELITDIARAIGFLSRIRVPSKYFVDDDGRMEKTARAFPLAGTVVALPAALTVLIFGNSGAGNLLLSTLALLVLTVTTGALHEDGLADTADGFGGRDREKSLEIMHDSRMGVYGVLALILFSALKIFALAELLTVSSYLAAGALLATAIVARAAMVWHWRALPAARPDGVAASAGKPDEAALPFALISAAVAAGLLLLISGTCLMAIGAAFASVALATYLFTNATENRLLGHTGDTIGATEQLGEVIFLVTLALAI